MLADIARQGCLLGSLLSRRSEIEAFGVRHLVPDPGGRTFVFGSGDGWFAARVVLHDPAGTAAAISGLDFLLRVAPRLGPADRALAVSMSGNVDRTVEAAHAAIARGVPLSILTNADGGRLGALGGPALRLGLSDLAPFLCGTASYTATLTALSLALLPGTDGFAPALNAALPDFARLVSQADAVASEVAAVITPEAAGVRLLATGGGVATADYGAAKLVEVATVPSWSDDIEEFAHRQFWSMKPAELVVLLPHDGLSAAYAEATADALADLGTPTLSVAPAEAPVPSARYRIELPGGPVAAAVTQAIALQLLAYRIGLATGTDPNRRRHLKDDARRFAVSRKLTRRSLLGTGQ